MRNKPDEPTDTDMEKIQAALQSLHGAAAPMIEFFEQICKTLLEINNQLKNLKGSKDGK